VDLAGNPPTAWSCQCEFYICHILRMTAEVTGIGRDIGSKQLGQLQRRRVRRRSQQRGTHTGSLHGILRET
jgi:hypothetical protein